MHNFKSAFKSAMVDCEVIRNGKVVNSYLGLISDTKDYNVINFEPDADIQVGDDIYCPIKKKHYIITNIDITVLSNKPFKLSAYFQNNFANQTQSTTIYNTYNPSNSIIGSQQNANINVNDCFNNLNDMISKHGAEDKEQLLELQELLKKVVNNESINKSMFSKFGDLIRKYSWLATCITQIISAWIQR